MKAKGRKKLTNYFVSVFVVVYKSQCNSIFANYLVFLYYLSKIFAKIWMISLSFLAADFKNFGFFSFVIKRNSRCKWTLNTENFVLYTRWRIHDRLIYYDGYTEEKRKKQKTFFSRIMKRRIKKSKREDLNKNKKNYLKKKLIRCREYNKNYNLNLSVYNS